MRLFLASFVIVFLLLIVLDGPANSTPNYVGLYQWRGYAEICVASEEIGVGCSLAQTKAVFDTREECKVEVPRLLDSYNAALRRRDPRAMLRAEWICSEDRSVFNA